MSVCRRAFTLSTVGGEYENFKKKRAGPVVEPELSLCELRVQPQLKKKHAQFG